MHVAFCLYASREVGINHDTNCAFFMLLYSSSTLPRNDNKERNRDRLKHGCALLFHELDLGENMPFNGPKLRAELRIDWVAIQP